jgi:hypothetical protein
LTFFLPDDRSDRGHPDVWRPYQSSLDFLKFSARATSHISDKGRAEMISKVYEVDPTLCPQFGGQMKVISVLTDNALGDRIINHLKLSFIAERPALAHIARPDVLMEAEPGVLNGCKGFLFYPETGGPFPGISKPFFPRLRLNH